MKQKGFATIFALCLILVIALIVRSIQEAEENHAREVVNFETEQALQLAAESGIVEAADKVRRGIETLPDPDWLPNNYRQKKIPVSSKTFKRGEQSIKITVEVWGERGKIYHYNKKNNGTLNLEYFTILDEDGKEIVAKNHCDGFYLMSRATIDKSSFGEKIYRRAYAYVIDDDQLAAEYKNTTIHFMELPTEGDGVIKKNS